MSIYRRLGLEPIINASGTVTRLGGAPMATEVLDAFRQAAGEWVPLEQLQAAASRKIAALTNTEAGLVTAIVTSAGPLDERRKDRLRRALSERTGQEVRLDVTVDEGLIGGAIAKVGDLVFDGSLRTQLTMLRTNLTKGS